MRTIPGMVVMCPSDDVEARAAVRAAIEHEGPVYIRFGRAAVPVINDTPDYHFEIGKGTVVKEGTDVTIVATGICVDSALGAAELLAADENPRTLPPRFIIAASKLNRVLVLGS